MKKTAILIVLYNKEIHESTTIETLLKLGLSGVKIVIHNNGPREISMTHEQVQRFQMNCIDLEFINCTDNQPLSVVYNNFIKKNPQYEVFSIFDDDSNISSDYALVLNDCSFEIELPKIESRIDNRVYYPVVDNHVFSAIGTIVGKRVFSIGSGLTFTRSVVDKFISHKLDLFDEHYALYGVDFSFFRRIQILQKKGEEFLMSSNFSLLHSLSKAESIQSNFRHKERLVDFALTVRHYPTPHLYFSLLKRVVLDAFKLNFKDVNLIIKTFFNGAHPR
ncbi:glycosyltransferase family 2 protein, partial [Klebsiella variicola]|uniref:glycosyltransferase family 2 protein n=1 Tax=Klebsiella variicola TaxID=244366 RepID=UPI002FFCF4DB